MNGGRREDGGANVGAPVWVRVALTAGRVEVNGQGLGVDGGCGGCGRRGGREREGVLKERADPGRRKMGGGGTI